MEKDSGLYNLNKGYAPQEKKDLMNDNPIAKDASGGRGGSWMSKHSQSKVGGSPAKMYKDSAMKMKGSMKGDQSASRSDYSMDSGDTDKGYKGKDG
ncbi:unnamed protein product, partial [marine sediment metagenome]